MIWTDELLLQLQRDSTPPVRVMNCKIRNAADLRREQRRKLKERYYGTMALAGDPPPQKSDPIPPAGPHTHAGMRLRKTSVLE